MSEGAALLDGLPGGLFGDVLGLAPLGPRLLSNNWRGSEGRARVAHRTSRAPTVRASLFPLRLHARSVRARANRHRARPLLGEQKHAAIGGASYQPRRSRNLDGR